MVLGTIYFAVHYRGFRRGLAFTLVALVALVAVGGIVGWLYSQQEEQQRQVARTLIKPEQIEITDATLSIGTYSEMKAAVTNKSPYLLVELALMVKVLDCKYYDSANQPTAPPPGFVPDKSKDGPHAGNIVGKCTTVGQYVAREYSLNIPSGQKRAFRGYVRFDNLPPLREKEWTWHYTIQEIVAGRE
jgi:hypothetical protein